MFRLIRYTTGAIAFGTSAAAYTIYQAKNALPSLPEWPEWMSMNKNVDVPTKDDEMINAASQPLVKSNAELSNTLTFQELPNQNDNDLLHLTKRLIEIRNLLHTIPNASDELDLPSIVVIGSQSSGKSSVLESIVGHEFLPKGSNMVTRRPIELTLIHTPESDIEYGEFPLLGLGRIPQFANIQRILMDLNLSVPPTECVSTDPIQLRIYSPHIPDLSLVDLPGYIQIHTKDQPAELAQKIEQLCHEYIIKPNVILAVSAADVDLANSEALRAARLVDPKGRRTIGVITKLDLVDPENGKSILNNSDYPLELGYIGLVCGSKFRKDSYARFNSCQVGTPLLRNRLCTLLKSHMMNSLDSISNLVQEELYDTQYQLKVEFNDEEITPYSYMMHCIDELKLKFHGFQDEFEKRIVKQGIKSLFMERVSHLCRSGIWNRSNLTDDNTPLEDGTLINVDTDYTRITKSGIGKISVRYVSHLVTSKLQSLLYQLIPWTYHESARQKVIEIATTLLQKKTLDTINQIENMMKPFKQDMDYSPLEWKQGQVDANQLLDQEIKSEQALLETIKSSPLALQYGKRQLRFAIKYLENLNDSTTSSADYPSEFLDVASSALEIERQIDLLLNRKRNLRHCVDKSKCPEVYLSIAVEKIAYTSLVFIYYELLNDFFTTFPKELESELLKIPLESFSLENPHIKRYMTLKNKQSLLLTVDNQLKEIKELNSL